MSLRMHPMAGLLALAATLLAPPARAGVMYQFTNFDGPGDITGGTTINGISNTGVAVGFTTDANMINRSFIFDTKTSTPTVLNGLGVGAMANGINGAGTIVGGSGTTAFSFAGGTVTTLLPAGSTAGVAFGINDQGQIVGQFTDANGASPGFLNNNGTITRIDAPSGPDTLFAQGINNNGLAVGFFVGTDGQDHGFTFDSKTSTFTNVADPTIPAVAGEPGATFVFSQILGINDHGIAVGYYGDSTTSQHGFLYNTNTIAYTFLDDPSVRFNGAGVEVTQITGIANSGEIDGFFTDADGLQHGFFANPVPEPGTMALMTIGVAGVAGYSARRRMKTAR